MAIKLKELFKKNNKDIDKEKKVPADEIPSVPDGLFTNCGQCHEMILTEDLYAGNMICPKCGNYFKVDAYSRISMVTDDNSFIEWDTDITESNPCEFDGYLNKVDKLKKNTGIDEAIVTGCATIGGIKTVIGICDTRFLMGSMGHVLGEKLTRAVERATKESLPVIIFTCSGGARMQEGMVSLMQMAKTSAALKKHSDAGNLYITVLTDPTTGGVTASFAMLGDIILAEPHALIGFAGPRVIKQTIGQELPKGFQSAEFLLEHGFIDSIVKREDLKDTLSLLLKYHCTNGADSMDRYKKYLDDIYSKKIDIDKEDKNIDNKKNNISKNVSAWERVEIARGSGRPSTLDYINNLTKGFFELHGDRLYSDDGAVVGGIAMFGKQPVTVIGHQKGTTTKENIKRNFGMANPEGYRKALRLIKQAEKFHRPVICFVDTPGAYCGIGAEERGQGRAIADNLYELSTVKTPMLSIITGEGGSGGALALALTDEVWMMENSVYSVLSPEGFASILWKDKKKSHEAAEKMKMTADDLYELGVIEQIIPEFPVLCEDNINHVMMYLKRKIATFLIEYQAMDDSELINKRYNRFRRF